jgi:hypothetical protein
MTETLNTHAAAAAAEPIHRICIRQRSGIWRVTLNDNFYGDYVRRYWALEAAFEKADEIAASGGAAIIVWTMDDQEDAMLYDTRRPATRDNAGRAYEWPRTRRWPALVGETFAKRLLEQARAVRSISQTP